MEDHCPEHSEECRKFKENVMDYIDRELDSKTLLELEKHMGQCIECEEIVNVYRKMLHASGSLKKRTFVTPEIRERLKKVLKQKYCCEDN